MANVHMYWYDTGSGEWKKTKNLWAYDTGSSIWRSISNAWIWDGEWKKVFSTAPGPVATVVVDTTDVTIDVTVDPTYQFGYTAYDADGIPTTGTSVSWTTTDPTGSVDSTGFYTAGHSDGDYDVRVTVDGVSDFGTVHVTGNGI